jgi:hypothetical protein
MPTSKGAPATCETVDEIMTLTPGEKPGESAQALASEALEVLATLMRGASSETAKIAACNALLDRGYGKARAGGGAAAEAPVETRVTVRFV